MRSVSRASDSLRLAVEHPGRRAALAMAALALTGLFASAAAAAAEQAPVPGRFCTNTAKALRNACRFDAPGSYWQALGACRNIPQVAKGEACAREAKRDLQEALRLCDAQLAGRREACGRLGEAAYAPRIDPADFVDRIDNPLFPLRPGTTLVYRKTGTEGTERVEITVTGRTEKILGVRCTVVHDVVTAPDGKLIEDTDDWYAQDRRGNVWYFGESTRSFENGRIASLEGSWRAGVDGGQAGIIVPARPKVGDVYHQEFGLGVAEDVAEVVSVTGEARAPAASCNKGCLVTRETTAIEPGIVESKFYARNVGVILEVTPALQERSELIDIRHK